MGSWLVPPIVIPVLIVITVVVYGLYRAYSKTALIRQMPEAHRCPLCPVKVETGGIISRQGWSGYVAR
jgi:hypothetical protein